MTYPNLYHLRYFIDAVELGSVSAAAKKNLVTHSAISQSIKSLEHSLGLKLIAHRKKAFEVYPEGYELVVRAQTILLAIEDLSVPFEKGLRKIIGGKLVLGLSRSLSQAFLGTLLRKLKQTYPEIVLEVKFGTTGELLEKLAQQNIDLALTIGHHTLPGIRQSCLRSGKFILIAGQKLDQISTSQYFLTEPRYETELFKKKFYEKEGKELEQFLEVGSWDVISQLVAEGQGIGLVPDLVLKGSRALKIRKLQSPWFECKYEVILSESKGVRKNELRQVVTEILKGIVC